MVRATEAKAVRDRGDGTGGHPGNRRSGGLGAARRPEPRLWRSGWKVSGTDLPPSPTARAASARAENAERCYKLDAEKERRVIFNEVQCEHTLMWRAESGSGHNADPSNAEVGSMALAMDMDLPVERKAGERSITSNTPEGVGKRESTGHAKSAACQYP